MKKIIIVCTAVIFSATVFAQNGSAGTNTSAVSVYKSPDILTDKAVAEAKKANMSNNVAPAPAPVGTHAQPTLQAVPVATKPVVLTKAEPTAPSRLVGIQATKNDMPVITETKEIPASKTPSSVSTVPKVPSTTNQAGKKTD